MKGWLGVEDVCYLKCKFILWGKGRRTRGDSSSGCWATGGSGS